MFHVEHFYPPTLTRNIKIHFAHLSKLQIETVRITPFFVQFRIVKVIPPSYSSSNAFLPVLFSADYTRENQTSF